MMVNNPWQVVVREGRGVIFCRPQASPTYTYVPHALW